MLTRDAPFQAELPFSMSRVRMRLRASCHVVSMPNTGALSRRRSHRMVKSLCIVAGLSGLLLCVAWYTRCDPISCERSEKGTTPVSFTLVAERFENARTSTTATTETMAANMSTGCRIDVPLLDNMICSYPEFRKRAMLFRACAKMEWKKKESALMLLGQLTGLACEACDSFAKNTDKLEEAKFVVILDSRF